MGLQVRVSRKWSGRTAGASVGNHIRFMCQSKSYVVCFRNVVSVKAALSRESSYGESQRAQFSLRLTQQPVPWHSPHQSENEILVLF